jgi:hypothetical protein
LELYKPTWWVEDKMYHARDGAYLSHKAFLINYTHNKDEYNEKVKRVNGWKDIYDCVTNTECSLPGWIG